ncbi:MAG: DUF3006 domain-containing protein [Oscillospiraceae bacterium]|jgi:hypothetical protein|nr:DUF3006 domain-containing protein [Oscillospiraceae bacterium]
MPVIDYLVYLIDGDYAHLKDQKGDEIMIALALLPQGVDEGDKLRFENYTYTLLH